MTSIGKCGSVEPCIFWDLGPGSCQPTALLLLSLTPLNLTLLFPELPLTASQHQIRECPKRRALRRPLQAGDRKEPLDLKTIITVVS